jgi:hypothetical protein
LIARLSPDPQRCCCAPEGKGALVEAVTVASAARNSAAANALTVAAAVQPA